MPKGDNWLKHGAARRGCNRSPEYVAWQHMLRRCRERGAPDYKNYGGRGIKVCERWLSFRNFAVDMGLRPTSAHSLDRINNDGNYEPGNVRWATRMAQSANRRNVRRFIVDGSAYTAADISRISGLSYTCVYKRLRRGISPAELLETP